MNFQVKLLKIPDMSEMSGWQIFDLMCDATHVAGRYWVFEGEVEALLAPVEVVATGVTEGGIGDMPDHVLREHCAKIFNTPWLLKELLGYQMLNYRHTILDTAKRIRTGDF